MNRSRDGRHASLRRMLRLRELVQRSASVTVDQACEHLGAGRFTVHSAG